MDIDYSDFIITDESADNESELANTQSEITEEKPATEVQGEQEDTSKETLKATEQTETQRVAQRIKEAQQQARDKFVAEQYEGQLWNGKPITTEAELKVALEESRLAEEKQKLIDEGVSELVAEKMIKADKYINKAEQIEKEQLQAQQTVKQQEEARQRDMEQFLTKFSDVDVNKIDQSVWEEVKNGTSLVQAYTEFKLKETESKLKVYEQNKSNKQKAPLNQGIGTHGSTEVASEDDFERGFNSVK